MKDIDYFVKRMLGYWISHVKLGERFSNCVVTYESLIEDPETQLQNLLSFMGISVDNNIVKKSVAWSDFTTMKKLSDQKGDQVGMGSDSFKGKFFRKGKVGGYKDELKPETIEYVKHQVRKHCGHLESLVELL